MHSLLCESPSLTRHKVVHKYAHCHKIFTSIHTNVQFIKNQNKYFDILVSTRNIEVYFHNFNVVSLSKDNNHFYTVKNIKVVWYFCSQKLVILLCVNCGQITVAVGKPLQLSSKKYCETDKSKL